MSNKSFIFLQLLSASHPHPCLTCPSRSGGNNILS